MFLVYCFLVFGIFFCRFFNLNCGGLLLVFKIVLYLLVYGFGVGIFLFFVFIDLDFLMEFVGIGVEEVF